jgi:class 3 adenylate cyclase
MDCAGCGRANRAGARFCGGCGKPLAPRCPACGSETQAGAQFCDACGAPLAAPQPPAGEARKVVTIVFADLIGSTALHERLDAESARRLMDRYHRSMSAVVEAQGGTVMQLLGDGVLAGFGVPRVAEDDAIRAVRAAVGMQQAFRELAAEQAGLAGDIGLRVAVYTGEVVAGDDHTHVMGDPVNVAARLQQEARDGDVLLGESTQRLVAEKVTLAPFGSFALKGRAEPVAAFRVVSLDRPAGAPAIAFVGREEELRRIRAVYDTAVATRAARLAVLLGSPGLGKSRLIDEFTRRLGDTATVLLARCDAAGGATFAPLAEALRGLLRIGARASGDDLRAAILSGLPEGESERIRIADGVAALLAGTPASPEEIFFVVRRGLAALAAERPVVLAIDDIQWAEPLLLDLIEHLVQWGSDVPLLVLAAARPELRDARSSLATSGGYVSDVVTLAGLDAGAATRLAANVIGAEALPAAIAGRVLATSEGNPLFVGELVRMLVHDGALKRDGDRWTAGVALEGLEMPPTIHALLAARIERLRPEDRMVLERAAVVGRHFSRTSLAQLLPREIGDLDGRLESLRRSELIEPDTGWFLGEPVLRFHHVLIRDAAYRRLLKNTRAELHARFADWLEARAAGAVEHDETLGWHLEQAHQHLRELGPIDAQGRVLGERAARHLAAAGRRALARDDLAPAAGLLGRALERLDAGDPARADLALDWCEALLSAGDVSTAARAIAELGRFTGDSERLRAWHTCFAGQLAVLTDPKALRASADFVEAAAAVLTSVGDAAGEAKAHSVHALVLAQLGKIGACEMALDKALAAARRARDRRRANAVLAGAPIAALWGPSPVTRASGRCLDVVRVLRITQGAPAVEAVALRCQAVLETLRGRAEAARRMIASSRKMVEELGITQRVLEADFFAGLIELLEGDAAAAERHLRVAYDGLRAQGLGIDAAQAAALLGRALLAQGRVAEAEAISGEAESLAGDSFKAAIAWRGVRAEALAARGEHAAAIELARAAVEIAAATDDLLDHASARQALAVALRAAGRSPEADAEEKRAIQLCEAKGATLLVERARRGAARSSEPPRSSGPSAAPAQPAARRVRPNAATANIARMRAVTAARDAGALADRFADDMTVEDHQRGVSYDREGALASWRSMLAVQDLKFREEPLATLADSLALLRQSSSGVSGGKLDVGAYELERLLLIEIDAEGRRRRAEIFAPDHLGDAVVRLYERYAELLPDGPARARAAATARSVASFLGRFGPDRWATALAPGIEVVDHRPLGIWSMRGAEALLQNFRSWIPLTDDATIRQDEILGLQPEMFLSRRTFAGTDRASGGKFERQFIHLCVFGSDGLMTRLEYFETDHDAEALARFDALTAEPAARAVRIENAATRAEAALQRAWDARDWEPFAALFPPHFRSVDRRPLMRLETDRDSLVASVRPFFEAGVQRSAELLATRGDRLALYRMRLSGSDGVAGPSEVPYLQIAESDASGKRSAGIAFGPDDLGAAYAELDARYHAGEAAPHARVWAGMQEFKRAFTERDWAALAARCSPEIVVHDRRLLGWETLHGPAAYLAALRSLVELAPDSQLRIDHVEMCAHGYLVITVWEGTREGGAYEAPSLMVAELDAEGRIRRFDQYDLDRLDAARARYAELRSDPLRIPPNAATRVNDLHQQAIEAGDWDDLAQLVAPEMVFDDRRHGVQLTGDRDLFLASRRVTARSARVSRTLLATAGDRLALFQTRWAGALEGGAFEAEMLTLLEVDANGRITAIIAFDPGDQRAASLELADRYFRSEEAREAPAASAELVRAVNAHDLVRLRAALPDDFYLHDNRRTGLGRLTGADAYVASLRAFLAETRDLTTDILYHVAADERGSLSVGRMFGRLADGGAFENVVVRLAVFRAGRVVGLEVFEPEDLEVARARFEALRP